MSYEPVTGMAPQGGVQMQQSSYSSYPPYPPQQPASSLYVGQVIVPNQSYPMSQGQVIYTQPSQPYVVHNAAPVGTYGNMGLAPMAVGRTRPANAWSDGICQCFSNCFPSCYCTMFCCCGNYLLAQISAKQGYKPFNHVFYFFMIIWIITIILLLVFGDSRVFILPVLTTCIYTIMLRLYIVQKDNIRDCASDPNCNMCGECCQSFWCTSCSVCQLARHTFGYAKVFDGDADPERKSGWVNV